MVAAPSNPLRIAVVIPTMSGGRVEEIVVIPSRISQPWRLSSLRMQHSSP